MKTIIILFSSILLNSCNSTKDVKSEIVADNTDSANQVASSAERDQDNTPTIEYSAISRGGFKTVKVSQASIIYKKSRAENEQTKACTQKQWDELINHLDKIDLNEISELEPPSKKHLFDGALHATLSVSLNGKTYQTKTFDHGNPPEKIAELVKYILTIGGEIE